VSSRAIVIHGHFYQPPRENPWLEAVEVQDSAAPFHDWNARVTAECYAPNTAARRVTDANRIHDLVNNFEKISFNVGPTLLSWLERHAREVYEAILAADRVSRAERGHGNALAQVYNHMIVPLASPRDRVTQVRWGLADFRARFGREPEGMWLPETAVDAATLEILADHGVRFTILAPHQARRVRPIGEAAWAEVGESIDPSRPYLWRGSSGRTLALFFYDGPISRAIAFEGALARGETLVARLRGGFSDARPWPQLVHCATDGESYGHHARFGDMALAAAVQQVEREGFASLTNYAAWLLAHPPAHEVEIREATSWSCAHGVERWRADCGCRVAGHTHQRWRAPLRETLDWLRDQLDPWWETRAGELLKDPWAARDEYIEVVLDRSPERLAAFMARHRRAPLDASATVEARRLLELQRNRLLMYTSCGWFFDELSGLEPVQILKYAAMAMQYAHHLDGPALEPEFTRRLGAAPTNAPEFPDGGEVYRRLVQPSVVDPARVVAHYAITGLFEDQADDSRVYAFRVERLDDHRECWPTTSLRVAHVRVTSDVTGEVTNATLAALHGGGHDFTCGVRPFTDAVTYERMKGALLARYARHAEDDAGHGMAGMGAAAGAVVREIEEWFPGTTFSLPHLFVEARRRVLANVTHAVVERHEETYRRIWDESRKLVHYLRTSDAPIPDTLAMSGRHVLAIEAVDLLHQVPERGTIPPAIFELCAEARRLGFTIDLSPAKAAMGEAIAAALDRVRDAPTPENIADATALVAGARELAVPFGLWAIQNRFFELWTATPDARAALAPLGDLLGFELPLERA
jgi:alpha-amylase/alpha-mannosidase (GH57 family)